MGEVATSRPRARDLGIPFDGTPGAGNAITDVAGIEVGCTTLVDGAGPLVPGAGPIRTGVTAIHPRGRTRVGEPVAAGMHAFNGNGEMTGLSWIAETGSFATPIALTNTHAVGDAHRAVIDWMIANRPSLGAGWLLPVVAETWDGRLNDTNGRHVRREHVTAALTSAASGPVAEGSVGGGTGMVCYGWKGGNGTASRQVRFGTDTHTVGVFVQANFGEPHELTIRGQRVGGELRPPTSGQPTGAGSVIVVVATDAPMLPGQCAALSRRVTMGVARTGTVGSHYSGDLFLAFSTANEGSFGSAPPTQSATGYEQVAFVPWARLDPYYAAVVDATEEAILNALVAGETITGKDDHRIHGLAGDELRARFEAR